MTTVIDFLATHLDEQPSCIALLFFDDDSIQFSDAVLKVCVDSPELIADELKHITTDDFGYDSIDGLVTLGVEFTVEDSYEENDPRVHFEIWRMTVLKIEPWPHKAIAEGTAL